MTFPAALCLAILGASPLESPPTADAAAADAIGAPSPAAHRLRYHPRRDPVVAAFAVAAWGTSEWFAKSVLAPSACTLCDRDPDGIDRLNGIDRWGRGARWDGADGQHTASVLSDLSGFVAVPLSVAIIDVMLATRAGQPATAIEDLVIVVQTAMISQLVNQSVKFIAGRERPFFYVLGPDERGAVDDPLDTYMSFYSGHANLAFALATSAGTVAELRGYKGRGLVWAVGLPLAALTAYLRVGADKHYLSDVLVGALAGTTFGVGLPALFHARVLPAASAVRVLPTSNGVVMLGEF